VRGVPAPARTDRRAAGEPHDAPRFPLDALAVHSVLFFYLARWFEEFLGGLGVPDQAGWDDDPSVFDLCS
jgi:hypothetical protein